MAKIYFDLTDVVQYATRNSTVVGIPRVQLNIISLLSRKYGGETIRCVFFNQDQGGLFEFDPAQRSADHEFDGERLLVELGLVRPSKFWPSKTQVKSYLKRFSGNKLQRSVKKLELYFCALFMRSVLRSKGFKLGARDCGQPLTVTRVDKLPIDAVYVCLGAAWLLPQIWDFAAAHKARGGAVVQMVYDLIPIFHPEYYSPKEPVAFKQWIDRALFYATKIICISEWTAQDLRRYAKDKNDVPLIAPIPLAHEFIGYDRTTKIAMPEGLSEFAGQRFILCVGTIEHRKNGAMLLKVWQRLHKNFGDKTPILVFAGKLGKGAAEVEAMLASDSVLNKFVRVIHSPTDQDLAWLYQNSLATTYPSTFEGWGLPVGESAWFGKYCVASRETSIPEVCGDLVEYVDPRDTDNVEAAISKVITDERFLHERERMISSASMRLWSDVADDIHAFCVK